MAMSEEFRRAMADGWEEAKKAKAERRAENRRKWSERRDWSDDNQHKIEAEVPIEPTSEAGGSRSLSKLRSLMANPSVALHRRLDAAEIILVYELGPGAAVGADPEQVAAASYRFLNVVVDDPQTPEALRFRALRSIAAVENARAAQKSNAVTNADKHALLVALVNAERSRAIRAADCWSKAKETDVWALRSSDDFPWPEGWPGDWEWPATSFAAELEQASDVTAFREKLRSIRARNRDDNWERFLGMADGPSATKPQKP
jgi:hypothetical protein